jgi:hypothetical protein
MGEKPRNGTVVHKDGNFFLEAEGKLHAIPVGSDQKSTQLKELVGQKVEVVLSEPISFAIGLVPQNAKPGVRFPRVICYFPADPWAFGVVEEGVRAGLAQQFLSQGILSKANYEKLGGE